MRRRSLAVVIVAVLVIAALVVGLTVGLLNKNDKKSNDGSSIEESTSSSSSTEAPAAAAPAGAPPVATTPSVVVPAALWPHDESDIPPDPNVRFGSLDNGMRYMIMSHADPPGKLFLQLHVDAGSFNEADDQQGLAHFLEHMMFNGLRNYSADELIPILQRLGIAFGPHANAYTTFDETAYQLDLPDIEPETLQVCFTVMRDYADGALLEEDEIEKERGVVLSELNVRDSVDWQIVKQQYAFLLPDHLISQRFPIGKEDVISTAQRDLFVDFYENFYIPQRITFVAVGDMDADAMETLIVDTFENMTNPDNPRPDPDLGTVPVGTGFRTAVFTDKELVLDEVHIVTVRSFQRKPDTEANRIADLPLQLAHSILGNRFTILANKENTSILYGYGDSSPWYDSAEYGVIAVAPLEDRWMDAVGVLEQEFRRAREYGFTEAELSEVKTSILNQYEQAVITAPTRESRDLASQLVWTVNGHHVFSSPEEDLRIVQKGLAQMTTELLHDAFKTFWNTTDLNLVLSTDTAAENTTDVLAALYQQSKAVNVTAPELFEVMTFAYTDFGPAGTIVSETKDEALEIRQLVLSNNVRVNLKQTDFEENSIILTASFGTGKLGQPLNQTGLDEFTSIVMNGGGLGNHSVEELTRMFVGKNVGAGLAIGESSFAISGASTPDDLELQLQLMAAYLTDPGYREEAVRQFRQLIPATVSSNMYTIGGAFGQMSEWLKGGDSRFAVPTEEDLVAFEASDARDWIEPQLANSYLELSIVGDFDFENTTAFVLDTFGALPMRAEASEKSSLSRELNFPATPANKTFTYESKIANAAAVVAWEVSPETESTINATRRLAILTEVLNERMRVKIREELGASYSPYATLSPSNAFDYGALLAVSYGTPEDSEMVGNLIIDIANSLAADGATQDEVDRALEPFLVDIDTSFRSNAYWLYSVLDESQSQPYQLDWSKTRDEVFSSVMVAEVNELARTYLMPEDAVRVEILPVDGGGNVVVGENATVSASTGFLRGPSRLP